MKRGVVPATIEVTPGAHIVEVAKDGFHTWIAEYSLRVGQRQHIDMVLEPEYERMLFDGAVTAKLVISSVPRGAKVILDDRPFGLTPADLSALTPGTHTLRMRLGDESLLRSITLAPEKSHRFHHVFTSQPIEPAGPPAPAVAEPVAPPGGPPDAPSPPPPPLPQLTVTTVPADAGALVKIDGRSAGEAPWTGHVPAGRRVIVVHGPGFETVARDVEVPLNAEVTMTVPLRAAAAPVVKPPARPPAKHRPASAGRTPTRRAPPARPLPARDRSGRTWIAGVVASADQERQTFRIAGQESSADLPAGERLGASVRWAKFLSDEAELGVSVDLLLDDRGTRGGQMLGVAPFLRLRLPIRQDGAEWGELYVLGAAGLAAAHADEAVQGGRIESFGGGWSAGWSAGAQMVFTPDLGLFFDGGWRLMGVTHTLVEADGAAVERAAFDRRWSEFTAVLGVSYSP